METIDKNNVDFEGIRFCAKAILKEEEGLNLRLTFLNVEANVMTGTDGSRLHQFLTCGLPDGNYQVLKNNKTKIELERREDVSFPDVNSVFPEGEPKKTCKLWHNEGDDIECSKNYTEIVRTLLDKHTVNYNCIKDLAGIPMQCQYFGDSKPLQFVCNGFRALVMPIRV